MPTVRLHLRAILNEGRPFGALLFALLLPACGGGGSTTASDPEPLVLELAQVVTGLTNPLDLQQPDDGTGRLFVVEQRGTIRVIQDNALVAGLFLDIRDRVTSGGETGLLGLAFHPAYRTNRRFFVNYTRTVGGQLQTVIAEYRASESNSNRAADDETILLVVDQPFSNHNGGGLAFGPDGYLYIALGDGGSGGDPLGNAQSLNTLLGKILRIDVDSSPSPGLAYAVPPDNPFVNQPGLDEIWAYGLRNPWRFSFDPPSGRLFAADVGQSDFEEVDLITRGQNYGWNILEGAHCYPPPSTGCRTIGLTAPIAEYGHGEGGSVTGGFVYRGARIPGLVGTYVFGDYVSGRIWGLRETAAGTWQRSELLATTLNISAFGQDQAGELYVLDHAGGVVYRLRSQGSS
ncbi:MAG: PQQ-dependent sugar dehydrogenase [Deltaproteobacteria bacterium]|nr:PQQ-dependent sugar dehydrogenase [Deltaproteobacteria bacterium]